MNGNGSHTDKLKSAFEDGVIMTQICVAMLASANLHDKKAFSQHFKDESTFKLLFSDCAKLNWQSQVMANINTLQSIKQYQIKLIISYIDIWREEGKIKNYLNHVYKNKQAPYWQEKFETILLDIKNDKFNFRSNDLLAKLINCNLLLDYKSQIIDNILRNIDQKFFVSKLNALGDKINLLQKTIQEEILLDDILFIRSLVNEGGGIYSDELQDKLFFHSKIVEELQGSVIYNDVDICVI
jgi:hypothetical protein